MLACRGAVGGRWRWLRRLWSRRYRCRVFVRCVDMKGNGAHVTIGATDAAGRFIKGMWAMTTALRGTLDWKEYQRDGLAFPEGTTRAWIACYGSLTQIF